ncbi:hypothetical protein [Streptomyces sp. Amel2xC10]|uniref:hypothetical protein n=1 Tax=Streptomyces sp. Amel2xC10 TaxID=1305826 RepID=UPI000A14E992|nr:hypothetical protein [Streptomyces sp. Amel2xC10]
MELLFETAVRARLLTCPLTIDMGPADGMAFEDAVGLVLSASPVLPVLSDPDLAMVARIADTDPDRSDELLADVVALRKDLAVQAKQLGDTRISGQLDASVTAAVQFDAEAHALPCPDDTDLDTVIDVVNRHVARVNGAFSETTATVPAKVVHGAMLRALRTSAPAVPVRRPSAGAEPFIRRAAEAEALIRLSTGDSARRNAAVTLAGRLYWQDEALRQALEEEAWAAAAPEPTQPFLSGSPPAQAAPDVPSIIAGTQRGHLDFSLGVSQWIGNACAQTLTSPTPVMAGSPAVPQRTVAAHRPLAPIGGGFGGGFGGPTPSGDRIFDPELGEERELTDREKTIRDWGVGGFFVGWVGLGAVSTIGTAPVGGAGGLFGTIAGGVVGTYAGMKLGEWKYDHGYGGMFLRAGEVVNAVVNPFEAIRYLLFGSQFD